MLGPSPGRAAASLNGRSALDPEARQFFFYARTVLEEKEGPLPLKKLPEKPLFACRQRIEAGEDDPLEGERPFRDRRRHVPEPLRPR